jgi:hypothetical protein
MKQSFTCALLLCLLVPRFAFAKQKESVFDWVRASDQPVQLLPRGFYQGRTYHPGPNGGTIRVDIQAAQPVTVAMVSAEDWNDFQQNPRLDRNLDFRCLREKIVSTSYFCSLPGHPMTLIISDELKPNLPTVREVSATLADVDNQPFPARNDLLITYYRWDCTSNCEPKLRWSRLSKQKYDITRAQQIYGIVSPQLAGRQISVSVKSSVSLLAALVPAKEAAQFGWNLELMHASACTQISDRDTTFKCTVDPADGPLALVLAPGNGTNVPHHTKAVVELDSARCVANCNLPGGRQ